MREGICTFFLLHLLGAAVWTDVKYRKIPNGIAAVGLLCGLCSRIVLGGCAGLAEYLAGAFLMMMLTGVLYYFRMIGAGDVKLLAVIGGFLGPKDGFQLLIVTFLVGGAVSCALLIKRRNIYSRFFYLKTYINRMIVTKEWSPYMGSGCEDGYLYFSIPIFISFVLYAGGVYGN